MGNKCDKVLEDDPFFCNDMDMEHRFSGLHMTKGGDTHGLNQKLPLDGYIWTAKFDPLHERLPEQMPAVQVPLAARESMIACCVSNCQDFRHEYNQAMKRSVWHRDCCAARGFVDSDHGWRSLAEAQQKARGGDDCRGGMVRWGCVKAKDNNVAGVAIDQGEDLAEGVSGVSEHSAIASPDVEGSEANLTVAQIPSSIKTNLVPCETKVEDASDHVLGGMPTDSSHQQVSNELSGDMTEPMDANLQSAVPVPSSNSPQLSARTQSKKEIVTNMDPLLLQAMGRKSLIALRDGVPVQQPEPPPQVNQPEEMPSIVASMDPQLLQSIGRNSLIEMANSHRELSTQGGPQEMQ
eukprot:gnl/TRDRNA2_/TRDRNA2_143416_c0_seq1.p1 gnl/TRDRNA2_/TRDRNA2_143416_c0~~gnl/TRDRNA2_/TRDRNA2_143416_c0_seq1.p1  ORF type:complete len:350 (+),score=51.49 gnl/TRDRNA2_/TRDRNA2_143416_c0_seq1:101-1150(+)